MKIAIASDLHLEVRDVAFENPGSDVLVLAGDICTLRHMDTDGILGDRFRAFFQNCTSRWEHVIYILGNHESYGYRIDKALDRAGQISGVHFLDNSTKTIGGVTFWGATLWTDWDRNPMASLASRGQMNDYRVIRTDGGTRRLTPEDTHRLHDQSILSLKSSRPDVVISHHLPSWKSIPDEYQNTHSFLLNHAYASHLDSLVEELSPQLWIHGHTHLSCDYSLGKTRIVCNPRGYAGYERQASQWQILVVEL